MRVKKSSSVKTWRFIDSGAQDGPFNMAADEALTHFSCDRPILRVYAWQPYTMSIGHHQTFAEVDSAKCEREGVGVVRRPTGGRAIFHAHEVTYAVIIPKDSHLYLENVLDIYNLISSALVTGLNRLGAQLVLERKDTLDDEARKYNRRFACFASSAKYEIHFQAKKLVGSAQRRFENALLQHGSILLGNEHLKLFDYLVTTSKGSRKSAKEMLDEKTTCLETVLNREVSYQQISASLKSGFEEFFKNELQSVPITPEENEFINQLIPNYTQTRREFPCETYV